MGGGGGSCCSCTPAAPAPATPTLAVAAAICTCLPLFVLAAPHLTRLFALACAGPLLFALIRLQWDEPAIRMIEQGLVDPLFSSL